MVSRKKIDLGGSKLTCSTFWTVDQSSPDVFHQMPDESFSVTSFQFWISCLVAEIFAIKVESCVKSAQSLHVFGPKIFRGAPEFLDLQYKIESHRDRVAKLHGDRPRELRSCGKSNK